MKKHVRLMEKKFFAIKQNSQSVLFKFFIKCVLYMTYAKEWPYYSKKNEQIHIMTLSYTGISQQFLRQAVLDRNMKNIHRILKETAECEPYEFAKVNTVALI